MKQFVVPFVVMACFKLAILSQADAGGPLAFTTNGPTTWNTATPIRYWISRGKLGRIKEDDIQDLIRKAFKRWSDVPTTTIRFRFAGLVDEVRTYRDFRVASEQETGGNVVALDDNGAVVAEAYGEDNRGRILGFACPVIEHDRISAFYSVMNGHLAVSPETFLSTLVHEFGHAIGLDHTQIHAEFDGDGIAAHHKYIPTMFPAYSGDDERLATLKPDDIAWISMLYPASGFDQHYGLIKGQIVRSGTAGTPVRGANVIAITQGNGEASRMNEFSCVSDWLANGDGEFVIPALPGQYKLHIEPIRAEFTGGSSVGPHSDAPSSPSFVNPVEPWDPPPVVTVTAGATTDVGKVIAE